MTAWTARPRPRAAAWTARRSLIEVVLLFRPVCSLVKVDQGFTSGCHSHGFGSAGMDLLGGQDAMGRVGPLGIVIGRPLADTVAGLRPGLEATQINAFVFRFADLRFSDRQRRSIIRLSIQRPLPSTDIFTSASFSSSIQSLLVNCDPRPVLKISGGPYAASASFGAATQKVRLQCVRQPPGQNLAAVPVHDGHQASLSPPLV